MSWACKTIALCAIALSTTLVSCEYDDTDLTSRINTLEERVAKLEKDLTTQIGNLQGMINGKLTINSCTLDAKTGLYTIVLSNGDTLKVAKVSDGAPVMGVVKIDGAYYWTMDGEPMLTPDGAKVPVAATPSVRVNTKTNEWEISPDGGKTWLTTGITATEGSSIFSKVSDDASFVYFTLSDGTQLKVAKNSEFRCKPLAGKQYFTAGESRSITLDMVNIQKSTINKPDGWKAVINNGKLNITAPVAANSYADQSGKIAIVAVAANGQISISEIAVAIGPAPHNITVDDKLNVKITNNLGMDYPYDGYYYGACKLADFSPEKIIEDIKLDTRVRPIYDPVNKTLAQLLGGEPEKGVVYAIYTVDSSENKISAPEDVMYISASSVYTSIEVSDITYENATISINAMGAGISQCWAGVLPTESYNPTSFLPYLDQEGYLAVVNAKYTGMLSKYAGGFNLSPNTKYTVWVIPMVPGKDPKSYTTADITKEDIMIKNLTMDGTISALLGEVQSTMSSVSAMIVPEPGVYKLYGQYLTDIEINGKTDIELVTAMITASAWDASVVVSSTACEIKRTGLLPAVKGFFISVGVDKDGHAGRLYKKAADTRALSYSSETATGTVLANKNTDSKLSLTGTANIKSYNYVHISKIEWENIFGPFEGSESKTESMLAGAIAENENNIKLVEATATGNLEVSFSDLQLGGEYYLFAVGMDKNGDPTHLVKVAYSMSVDFINKSHMDWQMNTEVYGPKLTNIKFRGALLSSLTSIAGSDKLTADITVGTKCAKYWIYGGDPSYIVGVGAMAQTLSAINKVVSEQYGAGIGTGNGTANYKLTDVLIYEYFGSYCELRVVWQDTSGKYYEATTINWQDLLKK